MPFLRKYGVAATIPFPLVGRGIQDFEIAATFAAGDLNLMKDEGAEANTTNLPTDEGTGYSIVLDATEMQMARGVVYIIDQTATKIWEDQSIIIETYGNASAQHAFDLDTANVTVGTNNDKTGYSISGIKTTLDALNDITGIHPSKNIALAKFPFTMVDANTGLPKAGVTVTSERSINGTAFAACANTAAEVSGGAYTIDLAASDLNGDTVMLKFTATGAKTTFVTVVTQDQ